MGDSPSIGVFDKEGITYMRNVKSVTEKNSAADMIGSANLVQLRDEEEGEEKEAGMPGTGIGGPAAGKKAVKGSKNSTANSSSNATAESNSTSDANSTDNATANASGNATKANKTKPEYNAPSDVMPYAAANDLPEEKPVDFGMERKDKVTPYLARPAKYSINYPEDPSQKNSHHKYASPKLEKEEK